MVSRGTDFEVLVVGAGHAGCEAALACARLGLAVGLITLDLDRVAEMSCNPAIGGLGKSQIVREIDALGGEMGRAADASAIHFRRLNASRGPAVRARRVQCDWGGYSRWMRASLDACGGLELIAGCVEDLEWDAAGRLAAVVLADGQRIGCRAAVLTTGTFLGGLMHTGLQATAGGRVGDRAPQRLTASLIQRGIRVGRLKTGTPPRLRAASIDFSRLEAQPSAAPFLPFSHEAEARPAGLAPAVVCHITRSNPRTHQVIRAGLDRSPLFSGVIQGRGPRYCPSIEDKVVRFADRRAHQVILEPTDAGQEVIYPNGISTSLPLETQRRLVATIAGLERAEIVQPGYAVEYDYVDPTQLGHDLQLRAAPGLYLAGQINGSSGYEEAAGQGLLAGINAARTLRGRSPLVLERSQAYIGVMIDDLVSRGASEPYRMFSSRAEFRLLLREDNAWDRLGGAAELVGLVPAAARQRRRRQLELTDALCVELASTRAVAGCQGQRPSLEKLLRRPEVGIAQLLSRLGRDYPAEVLERAEVRTKYAGYIERQQREAERLQQQQRRPIPAEFDYRALPGLSSELREKLDRQKPPNLGAAARVDGMTPAALMVISVALGRGQGSVPRGTAPSAWPG